MESEIEHLSQSGCLSEDYLWKVKNAYRAIKDDADWQEKRSVERSISYVIIMNCIVKHSIVGVIAGPIIFGALYLSFYFGMKETYSTEEMASSDFRFAAILYFSVFIAAYMVAYPIVDYYIFGGRRLKAYENKRKALIGSLVDEGIRDFGGAVFERDISSGVSTLEYRPGGMSKFLRDLKECLDAGHVDEKSKGNNEANFYSKGFKEKIGGVFAVSTIWVIAILSIAVLFSAVLFFLWHRLTN